MSFNPSLVINIELKSYHKESLYSILYHNIIGLAQPLVVLIEVITIFHDFIQIITIRCFEAQHNDQNLKTNHKNNKIK